MTPGAQLRVIRGGRHAGGDLIGQFTNDGGGDLGGGDFGGDLGGASSSSGPDAGSTWDPFSGGDGELPGTTTSGGDLYSGGGDSSGGSSSLLGPGGSQPVYQGGGSSGGYIGPANNPSGPSADPSANGGGTPWGWIAAGVAGVGLIAWALTAKRKKR